MPYTFTAEELDAISSAVAEISHISDLTEGKYRPVYDLIYEILTDEGNYFDSPVNGLEENVWIWISGAREVNSGEGYSAYFIREYTRSQYELRYGITLSDDDLNIASNTIASNFINDILSGTTPTIEELGLIDAAPIAGSIFDEIFTANYAGWSGTLLFPYLGIDTYFRDWILNDETVAGFKPVSGTYDLIAAAAASIPLTNNLGDVVNNFYKNFGVIGTISAIGTSLDLSDDTDEFFNQLYQTAEYNFSIDIGSDLFSPLSKSAKYIVGTLYDDTYSKDPAANRAVNGTGGKDVINAGLGDDVIFASSGDDLIDGGEGDDTIDSGDGDDLIVSGGGADKIIVGEGEDVILDGSTDDRLFIRSSLFGAQPVDGEDRLIPLLGGINSYINLVDFQGNPQIDVEGFYDANENGNTEYWFSSHFLKTVAFDGEQNIVLGENVFEKYNMDPFAIVYEMNEADLEISIYKNHSAIPPFLGNPIDDLLPKDIHLFLEPTAKVILADYQPGHYGIRLEGPHEIGAIVIDGNSTVDAAIFTLHNNFIAEITNNGNLTETLGEMTERRPLSDGETGEPIEAEIKTGEEDDVIIGDETDERIDAEAGDDIIEGNGGNDVLEGGVGDDIISGGAGENDLSGGTGNDVFIGGFGVDYIDGGADEDIVDYSGSDSAILVNLATGQATGGFAEGDIITGLEGVIGTDLNDTLIGSAGDDRFFGNDGADMLSGNAGDDILDGGSGADILDGGEGFDQVSYETSAEGVTVDLINQLASGGNALGDQLSNMEGVIGSHLTDTLIGDDLANLFNGNGGDDAIFGAGGNDRIEGGAGADMLDGGAGTDTLDYTASDEAVIVDLASSTASGGDAEGDQFANFENIIGSGNDDQLAGDAATNFIDAGLGNDTIIVTAGADILLGGQGEDTLDFRDMESAVIADLATATYSGGLATGLEALSFENISGSAFNDQITGTAFANQLSGGAGDDRIAGGGGGDVISGGEGANDTAVFSGNLADYVITRHEGSAIRIADQREDAPDGADLITGIETLEFADGAVAFADLAINNAAPIPVNDIGPALLEDDIIIISAADLLANDQDYDGDTLTITGITKVPDGEAELLGNGDIEFTPDYDFFGETYVEFLVSDGVTQPQTARVTLTVIGENDAPIALDDNTIAIYADQPTLIEASDILANDFEFDGDPLTIIEVTAIAGGTISLTPQGDILFTPTGQEGESAAFSYTVADPSGLTSTAFVQTGLIASKPITAGDDMFLGEENQPLTITPAELLANDNNTGDFTPYIVEVTGAEHGTATINAAGNIIFTPEEDYTGTAGFTYRVVNGEGGEDTAAVTITIEAAANTPPVAGDDSGLIAIEDTELFISAAELLANDSDADADSLTITAVSSALNGTVTLLAGGDVSFTPVENYNGPAGFTYTISDGRGGESQATVTINVTAVNDAPEAIDDQNLAATEDQTLIISASTLLANDSDAENDNLLITSVAGAVNGAVTLLANGDVEFIANPDYNGPASFTYRISDGNGGIAEATANLVVAAVNDAPTSISLSSIDVEENAPGGTIVGTLSVADTDAGDGASFTITGGTGADKFIINGNNLEVATGAELDYETEPAYSLEIEAEDSGGLGVTQSFTINLLDIEEGGVIEGTPLDDTLTGTQGEDIILGLSGDDTINALAGDDTLVGGSGADIMDGGAGIDTADYSGSNSGVAILLTTFFFRPYGIGIGGEAAGDRLLNIENVIGSDFTDTLIGNSADNRLDGAGGNDYLVGAAGRDQFVFKQGYGTDTILDFNTDPGGEEKISLDFEGIETFDDLSPLITPVGFFQSSSRIDFGDGDRLTLLGVRPDELSSDNFEFL